GDDILQQLLSKLADLFFRILRGAVTRNRLLKVVALFESSINFEHCVCRIRGETRVVSSIGFTPQFLLRRRGGHP
ncbi:hypothetical protein PMAYCL1PPCAC_01645, partial [Pristionchus mayeri]